MVAWHIVHQVIGVVDQLVDRSLRKRRSSLSGLREVRGSKPRYSSVIFSMVRRSFPEGVGEKIKAQRAAREAVASVAAKAIPTSGF